jgi:putative ABC transport system permease protein
MSWYRRLFNLTRSEEITRELDREFAHHIAERRDELMKSGMNAHDADSAARRQFGNATSQKERTRDVDLIMWLETCFADIRYAFRALRRSPAFALVAILSLALGIGANTAIFSLIDAVMLKSLPVSHPEQLVAVKAVAAGPSDYYFTNPLWEAIRDRGDMFAGAFATANTGFDLTTGGEVRQTRGEYVSGDYFNVLGVRAAIGRVFNRTDDVRGCRATAILSNAFWSSEFGGDPRAIGKSIDLSGKRFEIVGVTEPAYSGINVGSATQVYVPLCADAVIRGSNKNLDARDNWWITITARMRPEVADAQITSRLKAVSPPVFESAVPTNRQVKQQENFLKTTLSIEPRTAGLSGFRDRYKTALYTLMVVVAVVLLIACGNVANLLLARARVRQREAAVRLAVGAGRGRLVRQLLTESLVLSMLGTVAGVLLGMWGTRVLVSLLSTGRSVVSLDLTVDIRILVFTSAIAILTGVLFGIVPAWRSANVDPQGAMRGSGRGITGERHRFSLTKTLVAGQVALSLVLLVAAGLLLGSFEKQTSIDPGFRGEGVLVVQVDAGRAGIAEGARPEAFRALLDRLRAVPGVRTAAMTGIIPLGNMAGSTLIHVDGYEPQNDDDATVWVDAASPRYFETIGTRMVAGRDFGASDTRTSPKVAIVNEAVAARFYAGKNPVGQTFALDDKGNSGEKYEIVGVVKNTKYQSITEERSETIFFSAAQQPDGRTGTAYVLRTGGPTAAVIPAVRSAIKDMNGLITFSLSTLNELVDNSLARPRLIAKLSVFFGMLALLLAIVGLYGTMSYSVERRRNEIGIRIALGAARTRVLAMVLGEAGWMVFGGIIAGIAIAIGATRWISSLLYGVTPTDVTTYALSGAVLAVVALAASAVPAWRAARLDPMDALREE